jgi:integrase/recombinase XerD
MSHHSSGDPARTGQVKTAASEKILDNLCSFLENRGYAAATIRAYLRAIKHFHLWLHAQGKRVSTVCTQDVKVFLSHHLAVCQCPGRFRKDVHGTRAALHHLLAVDHKADAKPPSVGKFTPIERELNGFITYLKSTCGLSDNTCLSRRRYAGGFLSQMFKKGKITLRTLEPRKVVAWIARRSRACRPGTAGVIANCVRSYLRFCHFRGFIDERLLHAVPSVPHWRLAEIPRHLNDEEWLRFHDSFDTSAPVGRRDYAMALGMVEMGLRASEVSGLQLKDIDWRRSLLRVRDAKNLRERVLPLPYGPGRAIACYLRHGRPCTTEGAVFVRHRVPHGAPLTPELVRGAMRRAYARAGFPTHWSGTHLLRHTAATRMHQHGTSLKEIADVLGHRSIDTSAIYTKVNLPALRAVALPWPEVTP